MSNVFQLFEPKENRGSSIGLQDCLDNAVAKILASNANLTRMVEEVQNFSMLSTMSSMHFPTRTLEPGFSKR
jgi:hypothetical protein